MKTEYSPKDFSPLNKIEPLLDLLAEKGGKIVCSSQVDMNELDQARASERFYVDSFGYGYLWIPELESFPETVDGVKEFERWYPIDIPLPKELQNLDWLKSKSTNPKHPQK